jgi:hypothetical protein
LHIAYTGKRLTCLGALLLSMLCLADGIMPLSWEKQEGATSLTLQYDVNGSGYSHVG